jgi:Xrn1 helical domain
MHQGVKHVVRTHVLIVLGANCPACCMAWPWVLSTLQHLLCVQNLKQPHCVLLNERFLSPALPTLDIAEGALNKLIDLYKKMLPTLGGYLTHAGRMDRTRLEKFIAAVAEMELSILEERAEVFAHSKLCGMARLGTELPVNLSCWVHTSLHRGKVASNVLA